jgi:exonuclease III
MKIYYNNIRGVKSKINSLKEIIDDQKPHIICLSETLLGKEDNIEIKKYKFMYNSKKEGKGGIAIGIHEELFKKSILLEEKSEEYEATWIRISNNDNINVRIGTIYAPQESKTKKSVIEKMYNNIKMHKLEAEKRGEKIIISGDFNTKIGEYINGNKNEISKYGRLFLEIKKMKKWRY